jgi:partner of Y14 and mago protein
MSEGGREVGGNRRADGTMRKAVRVRAGFASEELDVNARAYKSKGTQLKEDLVGYIPGAGPKAAPVKSEADKRKERRQRKKEKEVAERQEAGDVAETADQLAATGLGAETVGAEDGAKEVKKLSKFLRQIEKIEEYKAGMHVHSHFCAFLLS